MRWSGQLQLRVPRYVPASSRYGSIHTFVLDTAVVIYGSVYPAKPGTLPTPVTSVYILDHQVVGSYTAPNVTEQLDHVVFWSASGLISTFHTMVVNITSASPDYPFLFDFIAFPYAAYTTPSVTLPSETVTSSSSTDGNTPSSRNDTAPFHRSSTGAIVGGVVGGAALPALACVTALWIWFRRPRAKAVDPDSTTSELSYDLYDALRLMATTSVCRRIKRLARWHTRHPALPSPSGLQYYVCEGCSSGGGSAAGCQHFWSTRGRERTQNESWEQ